MKTRIGKKLIPDILRNEMKKKTSQSRDMYLQDKRCNPLEHDDTHGNIWNRADVRSRIVVIVDILVVVIVDILVLHLILLLYIKRIRTGNGTDKKQQE